MNASLPLHKGNAGVRRSELLEIELEALFQVSQVLSRPFKLQETLQQLLQVLHEQAGMRHGMVLLLDPERGEWLISAVHGQDIGRTREIRYQAGEGIVSRILERGELMALRRIADEPRFVDRLQLYDRNLPLKFFNFIRYTPPR